MRIHRHSWQIDAIEWGRYHSGTPFTGVQSICSVCRKTKFRRKNGHWKLNQLS